MTRIAIIEKEKCNPVGCGGYLCIRKCPVNRSGKEAMTIDPVDKKVQIDEKFSLEGCAQVCVKICPYGAIHVVNLPDKLTESPLHRYGKNKFELFNAVVPKRGKVVGLLGRNGIGKSTALQILTNKIVPNLGDYGSKPDKAKIVEQFSNTSLGDYFKNLYSNKISVAYKPQRVELLRDAYVGKVKDLLKKADEVGSSDDYVKTLNMEKILDRDISELSGGELQRLAIAAVCVKNAGVFFFDEPTSFLDITLRVKVAKLIRDLAAKGNCVVIVEHDLAVLDYISDEIQIVYGQPATYGIIVQPQAVRAGINEYLDGFISSANMRFRDYKIKFDASAKPEISNEVLFEYPEVEKSYSSFSLKVGEGVVHKGEIMGIMGANGLVKSTFLRLLSGLERTDDNKKLNFEIAFKPQYLEPLEGTVKEVLESISKEKLSKSWFKKNVVGNLGLDHVWELDVNKLSGGEFQKLHIAKTLLQDAVVYAFDEPSAFIDVEDRMKVASILKDFVLTTGACAIVVDHDVQFIDHVSDSMLVFEGVPSRSGSVVGPVPKGDGLNRVLRSLNLTYRKDHSNGRARINKEGSVLDREQKKSGKYYYS